MGTLKLKEPVESSKFGIVYPANMDMEYFIDVKKRIFAEHPIHKDCYVRVLRNNIKTKN